ncbi:MAG: hypothetical protein PHQ80_00715 [Candidatus ainarchaeum sp.]|nr:hypothetical protein [Candidatus ainarchaeum sp.]
MVVHMAEAQKSYGKTLAFSRLQMIPVKEEQGPVGAVHKPDIDTSARKRRKE